LVPRRRPYRRAGTGAHDQAAEPGPEVPQDGAATCDPVRWRDCKLNAPRMILLRPVVLSCIAALACVVLAASPTGAAAPGADAATREKVKAIYERMKRQPMMFFVAKGGPNACGPGCSEWIAAEGMIDPDAAQRFRDFMGTLPRRDLPIFLNSIGGIAGQGIALGAMLREIA
jgi:hypothetical protein